MVQWHCKLSISYSCCFSCFAFWNFTQFDRFSHFYFFSQWFLIFNGCELHLLLSAFMTLSSKFIFTWCGTQLFLCRLLVEKTLSNNTYNFTYDFTVFFSKPRSLKSSFELIMWTLFFHLHYWKLSELMIIFKIFTNLDIYFMLVFFVKVAYLFLS